MNFLNVELQQLLAHFWKQSFNTFGIYFLDIVFCMELTNLSLQLFHSWSLPLMLHIKTYHCIKYHLNFLLSLRNFIVLHFNVLGLWSILCSFLWSRYYLHLYSFSFFIWLSNCSSNSCWEYYHYAIVLPLLIIFIEIYLQCVSSFIFYYLTNTTLIAAWES